MRSPMNHLQRSSGTKCGLRWSPRFENGGGRWCHHCTGEVSNRMRNRPVGIPGKRGKGHAA